MQQAHDEACVEIRIDRHDGVSARKQKLASVIIELFQFGHRDAASLSKRALLVVK